MTTPPRPASRSADVHAVAPETVLAFFRQVMPFNILDDEVLRGLARHCRIDFFPKGTKLFVTGKTEVNYIYLIQRGAVRSFLVDEQGEVSLKDYRGEGAYIGALAIIRGTRANLDVETVEDTFCFLLPKEVFLDLLQRQPGFAQYYLRSFSEKAVASAYNELRSKKVSRQTDEDLYLFSVRAGEIVKQEPVTLPRTSTIQDVAAQMSSSHVGSMLLHEPGRPQQVVGIVTDRDLRSKVVAAGLDHTLPVERIMSSPVRTVLSESICFDVLLRMMSTGIHHLAVERGGRVVGMITSHDIMLLQGYSPYYLFKEIVSQQEIRGLYPLAQKFPEIIRSMVKQGGKAGNITRMIAILNDHILERMLTLLLQEMGPPPLRFCWLLLGSEGRREQSFKTDQDNAILYENPADEAQRQAAADYFREFARRAIDHLVNCGYPLCPGEIMATNPKWCQPLAVWRGYFERWIAAPEPQELLNATIFFDFRAGYGATELATTLREHLQHQARGQEIFLRHLARDCMGTRAPLSFFRNFIVQRDGEHKNTLDVKRQGLTPFVDFARILALRHGVAETNTLARLKALADEEHLSRELYEAASEAYELQMQLRLVHQLEQIEEGVLPDNRINPAHLSELEKRTLKESFTVIERLQGFLRDSFHLGQ